MKINKLIHELSLLRKPIYVDNMRLPFKVFQCKKVIQKILDIALISMLKLAMLNLVNRTK